MSHKNNLVFYLLEKKENLVFDAFAGIGGFSIPLCKGKSGKKFKVSINDYNPEACKMIRKSLSETKSLQNSGTLVFNLEAWDFLKMAEVQIRSTDNKSFIILDDPNRIEHRKRMSELEFSGKTKIFAVQNSEGAPERFAHEQNFNSTKIFAISPKKDMFLLEYQV